MVDKNDLVNFFDGDLGLIKKSIDVYLDNLDEMVADITTALDKQDCNGIEGSVHKLKGSTSNFVAEDVVKVCAHLISEAKNNDIAKCNDLFLQLNNKLNTLVKELKEILESL